MTTHFGPRFMLGMLAALVAVQVFVGKGPDGPVLTAKGRPDAPLQRTGHGDLVGAPDGTTWLTLDTVPATVGSIVFPVSIYEGDARGQSFGQVRNAFIRVVDQWRDLTDRRKGSSFRAVVKSVNLNLGLWIIFIGAVTSAFFADDTVIRDALRFSGYVLLGSLMVGGIALCYSWMAGDHVG